MPPSGAAEPWEYCYESGLRGSSNRLHGFPGSIPGTETTRRTMSSRWRFGFAPPSRPHGGNQPPLAIIQELPSNFPGLAQICEHHAWVVTA
jgi:hypothetical protein